jgi:hypothetical protein
MGLKGLAEGIILQSIDDLWVKHCNENCIAFFKGEGFSDCAEIAGMTTSDQIRLLNLVKNMIENPGDERNLKVKPFGQARGRQEFRKETANSIL